jgi:ubiquinone/menaquinone biosynthesis C-methylase UbiE
MSQELEQQVASHYGREDLTARLLEALRATGIDPDRLSIADLAPVDEFHIGGRPATEHCIAKMSLRKDQHVLDVGCGIGGPARYIASTVGCRITGIDLTPEFIDTAGELTRRTGLSEAITYAVASALDMPFEDGTFDAAITIHVAMNIRDRAGLYREVARVLKPGAQFCVYDVMQGEKDGVLYPVPWAESAATSHLTTPKETAALLEEAGFAVHEVEDRREVALAFFRERVAAASGGPAPLTISLLMTNARAKYDNMLANVEQGCISPVLMLARKR